MKAKVSNTIKSTIAALAMLFVVGLYGSDVEIRFEEASYNAERNELYVDVQVKSAQQSSIILAGQNYRFYYNSEVLSLDASASESNLSGSSYSQLRFENNLEGIEADHVNQLIFDDNLGFANFSIDLTNTERGGVAIGNEQWTTVATLMFRVKDKDGRYDLVWGRNGVTDLYATAFVEIGEWTEANLIDKVRIVKYIDLSSEFKSTAQATGIRSIQVGPNPTADFLDVAFDKELQQDHYLVVRDLTGRTLVQDKIQRGSISRKVDLSQLIASSYLLEIISADATLMHRTQIVVAK